MSYRKIEAVEKWCGAEMLRYEVGKSSDDFAGKPKVKEIGEHLPMGPGDVCYYEVMMEDGSSIRLFYPDVVEISKPINLETPKAPGIIT